jgi:RNA polymerase sigma-54 factor
MVNTPRLELRQNQALIMTPQLRQAIMLLQFSNEEVAKFVEQELERNPLLEKEDQYPLLTSSESVWRQSDVSEGRAQNEEIISEPSSLFVHETEQSQPMTDSSEPPGISDTFEVNQSFSADFYDHKYGSFSEVAGSNRSLYEHLAEQIRINFTDSREMMIGAYFLALLSPEGRLTVFPDVAAKAMGIPIEDVEVVRAKLMRFDPVGIFAIDIRECLSVQLAERNRLDPAMAMLLQHLHLLISRDYRKLTELCAVDVDDLKAMIGELQALNPKPGASWDYTPTQVIVPDLVVRRGSGDDWIVELNEAILPRLLVNDVLLQRVSKSASRDDKAFLQEHINNANWLVRSLRQRAQTILKVATEIVRQQDGFLDNGVAYLRPLALKDIALTVGLHESTVSRVTANKYIASPRGTFELKYFFSNPITNNDGGPTHSSASVRHRIRSLISGESSSNVLSDDSLVVALRQDGIDIARRTVAKYREALKIPSSVQRKRAKNILL